MPEAARGIPGRRIPGRRSKRPPSSEGNSLSTHRTVTRLSGLLVAGTFVLAACSSSGASTAPSAAAPSAAATSAASGAAPSAGGSAAAAGIQDRDLGRRRRRRGCRLCRRQGGGPGQPHRHAAGLGELRASSTDFKAKYRIKVHRPAGRQQPAGDRRPQNPAGNGQPPDVFDLATSVALPTRSCSPRTRSRPGPTSRREQGVDGLWSSDYAGFTSIGYDANKVPAPSVADLPSPSTRARSPSTATRSRRRPASMASSWPRWPMAVRRTTSPPA